ncbi:MAG: ATP-binding protein [Candidatus Parcubacteria bacterium]|nr:ATP-binding protein [Candidatus Parcubacteria bacterium]
MSTIYYMIGIPGSGKSFLAKKISLEKGIPILSSDKKLEEFQKEGIEYVKRAEIFDILAREAFQMIKQKQDFIWDATNINPEFRKLEINNWKRNGARILGYLMVVSKEIASERNLTRDRKVPPEVIDRYWETLINNAIDTEAELFDEISIVNEKGEIVKVYKRELSREHNFEIKLSPKELTPRPKLK